MVRDSGKQWQCLRPQGYQGRPFSGERQRANSGNALDYTAIRVGPLVVRDSGQTVASLRPHGHQGRPSVVRDSGQTVAMP